MTLENNEKSATQNSEVLATSEVGLSSAMHDIRMLAATYTAAKVADREPSEELQFAGATMNPALLLAPRSEQSSDRWRVTAMIMMMVLGLSTSAFALTLYYGTQGSEPSRISSPPAAPAQQLSTTPSEQIPMGDPNEPALYPAIDTGFSVPDASDGVMSTTRTRQSISPDAEKRRTVVPAKVTRPVSAERLRQFDEATCLLDATDPRCQQFESVRELGEVETKTAARPYRLTRAQALTPLQGIQGRVRKCFDQHDLRGTATVKIVIAPAGTVQSFALVHSSSETDASFSSCVQEHVEKLQFEELRQPFTLSFPFSYR